MRTSLCKAGYARLHRALAMSFCLTVAGCGGGGGAAGSGDPPAAPLLTADNAWSGPVPEGAEIVSTAEFERRLAAGTLKLNAPGTATSERASLDAAFLANRAALNQWADKPPYVQALLDQTANDVTHPQDVEMTLPNGTPVTLLGRGAQVAAATEAMELAHSTDNALQDYALTHGLLPSDLKAALPDPDSLRGKPLEEVRAALSLVNQMLGQPAVRSRMTRARLEPAGSARADLQNRVTRLSAVVPAPGAGSDTDGICSPLHDVRTYWFPLKNFVSPMKQQGNRNTCWAFGAIGALESRERVLNANPVDLSEQFLVNKVRREWFPNDLVESGSPVSALNAAADHGQSIPAEASWTYNPSPQRMLVTEKLGGVDVSRFVDSCGKPGAANRYTGTCSDAVHQSHQVCTDAQLAHCAYDTMVASGPAVPSSRVIQVWQEGAAFDLDRYEFLLNNGHVLMANVPVFDGFSNPTTGAYPGLLTDFRGVHTDAKGQTVGGSAGDHVVQIVGFLPDNAGGRFIIKNSWGCGYGDAGYVYVPTAYVQSRFHDLYVLNFESRRSDAWNAEQASQFAAPGIQLFGPAASADLRVAVELTTFFSISHPVQKSAMLRVTSDRDGELFNGAWSTDAAALIPPLLPVTFATEGDRVITLSANLPGSAKTASVSFVLNVRNSAPTVEWQYSGAVFQGESFPLNALVRDINETDSASLCRSASWSVDAPDAVLSPNGCSQRVTFGATGERQVRVTVRDSEGMATAATLRLTVQAPPVNPFPRVLTYGVYSREITGGLFKFCGDVAQAPGATLDLRAKGCDAVDPAASPQQFHGSVTVENPTLEPLTYEWKLFVKSTAGPGFIELYGATDPVFELSAFGNSNLVTRECYVDVTVQAPQPERSKRVTAWSGRCTYFGSVLK